MADFVGAPARLRVRSIALIAAVGCVAAVLLWVGASVGYSIGYTLVGPKIVGRVKVTGCDTVVSNTRHFGKQSSTSCVATFVSTDGTVRLKGVDVRGEGSDAIDQRGQLVSAVGRKPATVYVGNVAKGLIDDFGLECFVLLFGLVAAGSAWDIYKRRRYPSLSTDESRASTDRRQDRPVS